MDRIVGFVTNRILRRFTDRACYCQQCNHFVGYVARDGHRWWVCDRCNGGKVKSV